MESIGAIIKRASNNKREVTLKEEDEEASDTEAVLIAKELSEFG
jgi:hypothetical protein